MSDKRSILEKVASGELSPEDAAALLSETRTQGTADEASPPPQPPGTPDEPIARIRVVGAFRTARIVADPNVQTATVEGEHTAEHRGKVLVINAETYDPGETDGSQFRFSSGNRPRVMIGLGSKPYPLTIRMNPDLPLDVEMAAGTLTIDGVRAPIMAEVSAGSIRINGFRSPIDVSVAGGSVSANGLLDEGESRIRCEAGLVKVKLDEGSSVRIRGRAGLGRIELPGQEAGFILGSGARETAIGEGAGLLDIDVSMGLVSVTQA